MAYGLPYIVCMRSSMIDLFVISFRFYNWIGKYDYESLKDEQLEMGGKVDLIANEVEAQKKEIKRQKDKMKTLIAMLEEQTAYTQKIAQKLKVSDRTA